MLLSRRVVLAAALVVLACSHADTFGIRNQSTDLPFVAGTPTRLTYNVYPDSQPSWFPGDSLMLYTAFRMDHDSDGCIEVLAGSGGQALRSICEPRPPGEDSMFAYESGAVSSSGVLAYLRSAKVQGLHHFWTRRTLVVRPLNDSTPPRTLEVMPAVGVLPPHNGGTDIAWLDDHRFVYRADAYQVVFPCNVCTPYDVSSGLIVNLVDIAPTPATITNVPNTTNAYSVAVQDSDHLLLDFPGDTHIYRLTLSTDTLTSLVDFAPDVPGEIAYANHRLVVAGSQLWMVDLPAGTVTSVLAQSGWANPALFHDGKRLVAQHARDLWLFQLP